MFSDPNAIVGVLRDNILLRPMDSRNPWFLLYNFLEINSTCVFTGLFYANSIQWERWGKRYGGQKHQKACRRWRDGSMETLRYLWKHWEMENCFYWLAELLEKFEVIRRKAFRRLYFNWVLEILRTGDARGRKTVCFCLFEIIWRFVKLHKSGDENRDYKSHWSSSWNM